MSLSYFTDLQGSQTTATICSANYLLSYFTDLQGSQTIQERYAIRLGLVTLLIYKVLKPRLLPWHEEQELSYFTDLQGSQTTTLLIV